MIILEMGLQPSCDNIFSSSGVMYFLILENTRKLVSVKFILCSLHDLTSSHAYMHICTHAYIYVHFHLAPSTLKLWNLLGQRGHSDTNKSS